MVNHKEILRLKSLGLTHQEIIDAAGCGRNTVTRTLARAREQKLDWQQAHVAAGSFPAFISNRAKESCLQDAGLRVGTPRDAEERCHLEPAVGGIL